MLPHRDQYQSQPNINPSRPISTQPVDNKLEELNHAAMLSPPPPLPPQTYYVYPSPSLDVLQNTSYLRLENQFGNGNDYTTHYSITTENRQERLLYAIVTYFFIGREKYIRDINILNSTGVIVVYANQTRVGDCGCCADDYSQDFIINLGGGQTLAKLTEESFCFDPYTYHLSQILPPSVVPTTPNTTTTTFDFIIIQRRTFCWGCKSPSFDVYDNHSRVLLGAMGLSQISNDGNFGLSFFDPMLSNESKAFLLIAGIYLNVQYFEYFEGRTRGLAGTRVSPA